MNKNTIAIAIAALLVGGVSVAAFQQARGPDTADAAAPAGLDGQGLAQDDAALLDSYQGLDALLIEANHCRDMLGRGHYPMFLKQRVGGDYGHLNNHQAARLVSELGWQNLQHLVLAHLSSKNNLPQLARQCFVDALGCDPDWLQVANQDYGLDWREIA